MKNLPLYLAIIFVLMISHRVLPQPTAAEVQSSGLYLFGIGEGQSFREADNAALDHLITQITVQVESYFEDKMTEKEGDIRSYASSVVKTYSNVSLNSARSMMLETRGGKTRVMRYISLKDLDELFENRRRKIFSYIQSGQLAEHELRIGDALKNYYWAYLLLQTHRNRDELMYNFNEENPMLLITALPDKINAIFSGLEFEIVFVEQRDDEKYKAYHLKVNFKDKPVETLDFNYWQGLQYSLPKSVNRGLAVAEFFGDAFNHSGSLKITVEYAYENKSTPDKELTAAFANLKVPYFDRSEIAVNARPQLPPAQSKAMAQPTKRLETEKLNQVDDYRKVRKNTLEIIEAIHGKNFQAAEGHFTPEGLEMYNALIKNGNVKVLPLTDTLRFVQLDGKTMVRAVPMQFSFSNNNRHFVEHVVFTFDENQKIEALSFAISDKAISDIVNRSERFGSVEDKFHLINFLEHYKTAYSLKRLDHIQSIFADNALIIVGHVVKGAEPIDGMYAAAGRDRVEFIELSKSEYIGRLRNVFNSNEFVNIHFEENIVKKVNGEAKIYGIQIKQDYFSSTYSDKGYLFLMIDLNDSINPKIYVRTWQPQRNPDGSIFGLDDFYIN
jgi:hypothetical protein